METTVSRFFRSWEIHFDLVYNSQFQETPLHFACKYGHEDVVSYLLTFHALDTEMVNKHGETAYDVAGRNSSAHSKHKVQTLLSGLVFLCVFCV